MNNPKQIHPNSVSLEEPEDTYKEAQIGPIIISINEYRMRLSAICAFLIFAIVHLMVWFYAWQPAFYTAPMWGAFYKVVIALVWLTAGGTLIAIFRQHVFDGFTPEVCMLALPFTTMLKYQSFAHIAGLMGICAIIMLIEWIMHFTSR